MKFLFNTFRIPVHNNLWIYVGVFYELYFQFLWVTFRGIIGQLFLISTEFFQITLNRNFPK